MREVQSAHRTRRPHRVTLGKADAGVLLGVKQLPQQPLLRVIRTGGITGGGTDAAIFFANQLVAAQGFVSAVAPLAAGARVQALGKRLG